MKIQAFRSIKPLFFTSQEAAQALRISRLSAVVTCHRYTKNKLLIRLKRDLYMLPEKFENLDVPKQYALANRLQVPSYISLTSALSFYEITTQVQQSFFESIAVERTKSVEIRDTVFKYFKIQKKLYFGFVKKEDFFIASPEKAFLDALYFMSLSRYRLDLDALDIKKFNLKKLKEMSKNFPLITQKLVKKYAAS